MLSSCKPRQKRENLNIKIEINQFTIDRVKESMLLGVIFYENLLWKPPLQISLGKVLKSTGIIYKAIAQLFKGRLVLAQG